MVFACVQLLSHGINPVSKTLEIIELRLWERLFVSLVAMSGSAVPHGLNKPREGGVVGFQLVRKPRGRETKKHGPFWLPLKPAHPDVNPTESWLGVFEAPIPRDAPSWNHGGWHSARGSEHCDGRRKVIREYVAVVKARVFGAVAHGYGSTSNHQGTAGFSPYFHLPGFHFRYIFLTHSHIKTRNHHSGERLFV